MFNLAITLHNAYGDSILADAKDGYKLYIPITRKRNLVLRVMREGGPRKLYWRLSEGGKEAYTADGRESKRKSETHNPITNKSEGQIKAIVNKVRKRHNR